MEQQAHLIGEKYINPLSRKRKLEDGFEVSRKILDLAYWCIHPDTHQYIIEHFNNGQNTNQVMLEQHHLAMIIDEVPRIKFPTKKVVSFGRQEAMRQLKKDAEIFAIAMKWLRESNEQGIEKTVFYITSN
ncbi:MAG: hypothetical protein JXR03_18390 [Cyclobacteriaceae bacterium]